jgi:hypothetical protein
MNKYDVVLYHANGTSIKTNDATEYYVNDGVLTYKDAAGIEYVTNMPFYVTVRKPRK